MHSPALLRSSGSRPALDLPLEQMSRLADMPEKRLMLAVLLDAIVQLRRPGSTGAAEAAAWITGAGHDEPFSFRALCEALGLDPVYLTRGVYAWARGAAPVGGSSRLRRSQGRALHLAARRRRVGAVAP